MKVTEVTALRRDGRRPAKGLRLHRSPEDVALMRLRRQLIRPLLAGTNNPALQAGLRRAAAEAESLAWLSPYPLLVLPGLLEEKVRKARLYAVRQARLRDSSREWLSLAE